MNSMKLFSNAMGVLLFVIFMVVGGGEARGEDCREHLDIGFDLHTSKHSMDLSGDKELLNKIRSRYEMALALCPDLCAETPALCNNLGDVYQRLGKMDDAVWYYKKAVDNQPEFGDALFELGRIFEGRGLYGSALDYYLRSLGANKSDVEAERRAKDLAGAGNCVSREAEAGEVLSEDQVYDSLICPDAFERAREKFGLARRAIVPSRVALRNIRFDLGKATLRAGSKKQLDALEGMMARHPGMRVVIEGHTCDLPVRGSLEVAPGVFCKDNQCLSEARAGVVKARLAERGVETGRLYVEGYGDSRPFAVGDRVKNRRVQLRRKKEEP
ncbi:MAG: OmpA family protein [Desulfobacterales bacterium]|nr:OmpA family protein [Desulfobacterales bacterium]